jgi:hypothetical protein
MSVADRPNESAPSASDIAAACRDAGLVRLVATADGDALAATGLLARALAATDVPFQASVARIPGLEGTEADVTLTVGTTGGDVALAAGPLSATAYAAAGTLGDDPDPVLALAGTLAGGFAPGEDGQGILEACEARGVTRRPGIAAPVADDADALAHTTWLHGPFSGDADAAEAALADCDRTEEAGRVAASYAALACVQDAPPRAAEAVGRALHPYAGGPVETVGGYADVLEAVARERPGTGVALALGYDAHDAALAAWREHAQSAHAALKSTDIGRYEGCVVVRTSGPVSTVARLARDFRSPEPVALVVADGEAAVAGTDDVIAPLEAAADAVAGEWVGRGTAGYARFSTDTEEFTQAFREAL